MVAGQISTTHRIIGEFAGLLLWHLPWGRRLKNYYSGLVDAEIAHYIHEHDKHRMKRTYVLFVMYSGRIKDEFLSHNKSELARCFLIWGRKTFKFLDTYSDTLTRDIARTGWSTRSAVVYMIRKALVRRLLSIRTKLAFVAGIPVVSICSNLRETRKERLESAKTFGYHTLMVRVRVPDLKIVVDEHGRDEASEREQKTPYHVALFRLQQESYQPPTQDEAHELQTIGTQSGRIKALNSELIFGVSPATHMRIFRLPREEHRTATEISAMLRESVETFKESKGGHVPDDLVTNTIQDLYASPRSILETFAESGYRLVLSDRKIAGKIIGTMLIARKPNVALIINSGKLNVPFSPRDDIAPDNYHWVINWVIRREYRKKGYAAFLLYEALKLFDEEILAGRGLCLRADPPYHDSYLSMGMKHETRFDRFCHPGARLLKGIMNVWDFNQKFLCNCPRSPDQQQRFREQKYKYSLFTIDAK